jgi:hypothetical protein
MSEALYGLPYPTRLEPGMEVLVDRLWSPWQPLAGGGGHFSTLLSELEAKLPISRRAIAGRFVRAASQSGRRPCTVLLVQKDTSVYLEVFSEDLFFWETWLGRAFAFALAYRCGSYAVDGGRAMWIRFA